MTDAWDFPEEWDGPRRDAIRAYFEASDSRVEVPVTDKMRKEHEGDQVRWEAIFLGVSPHPYMVGVRKIRLDPTLAWETTSSVVKFSKRRHSPVRSAALKLSTAEHYRTYEGGGAGIRDTDEGVYRKRIGFHEKWALEDSSLWCEVEGSVSMTYQTDNVWFYCTSLPPRSRCERIALEGEFEADCVTALGEPAMVARELGSAFAHTSPGPKVSLDDPFHQLGHRILPEQSSLQVHSRQRQILDVPFEQVIWVTHGPVVYTDNAESLIEAVPPHRRAAAIPFVKSPDYAHQREYRFAVSTIGEPAQETVFAPNTPELRALATEST